jgi:hypothetical protein
MSKLRQRIRDAARRRSSTAMGFALGRAAEAKAKPALLVGAEANDAAAVTLVIERGAGAILYTGDSEGLAAAVTAAGDVPVGRRVDAATQADASALAEAGTDFIVFDASTTAAEALGDRKLGHVLVLHGLPTEEELRLLGPLDVEAVLIDEPATGLTIRDQLLLRRVASILRAPLAVQILREAQSTEIEVWRDAGAGMLLVVAGGPIEAIVEAASGLRPPHERGDERQSPLLPTPKVADPDDDDDF